MAQEIQTEYKKKIQDRQIDLAELIRGADVTQNGWTKRENEIQQEFIWGIGPEAFYQRTWDVAENSVGPDSQKPKHRKTSGVDW